MYVTCEKKKKFFELFMVDPICFEPRHLYYINYKRIIGFALLVIKIVNINKIVI